MAPPVTASASAAYQRLPPTMKHGSSFGAPPGAVLAGSQPWPFANGSAVMFWETTNSGEPVTASCSLWLMLGVLTTGLGLLLLSGRLHWRELLPLAMTASNTYGTKRSTVFLPSHLLLSAGLSDILQPSSRFDG